MPKRVSQFEKWFKAQFGRNIEDFRERSVIDDEIRSTKAKLARLECELAWKIRIETGYEAARYTLNASRNKFKF